MNAFEEAVVLSAACGCTLVGMVTKNFLAVSALYLVFGSFVAVFGETKNGIVILTLSMKDYISTGAKRYEKRGRDIPSNPSRHAVALEGPPAR